MQVINRISKLSIVVILILVGILVGYGIYATKQMSKSERNYLHKKEDDFRINSNLVTGLALMNDYWNIKEFNKTIFYGNYCINEGVNKTKQGWYVNLLLANSYFKLNDKELTCSHSKLAIQFAERDNVSNKYLEELGLKELLTYCK